MLFSRSAISFFIISLLFFSVPGMAAKKFKRALIIAGGSITPGIGIGIVAALRAQGQEPDVVITTCGSSLASMMMNSMGSAARALELARAGQFYYILNALQIKNPSALAMGQQFSFMRKHPDLIPSVFASPLLTLPENMRGTLPYSKLDSHKSGPRFIIQSSRALFRPENVGAKRTGSLYQQVYFTDPDTGSALEGMSSPVRKLFPDSYVLRAVKVVTDMPSDQAARAGVSDPMLLNPAKIGDDYYFTGAIDLIPLELAHQLADEVISTYPVSLYEDYENLVIKTNFGFTQNDRVLRAIQDKNVRWIDLTGLADVDLAPELHFLKFYNRIPVDGNQFVQAIQKQYDFGYSRGKEALLAHDNTSHLRTPINPKLLQAFTCANANVWRQHLKDNCTSDWQYKCYRERGSLCVPIR